MIKSLSRHLPSSLILHLSSLGSAVILFLLTALFISCSSDESDNLPPPPSPSTIAVAFENARVIEIDAANNRALLLHDRESSSGTAIELVDIGSRSVVNSRILDYFDVYDIKFINDNEACFAGRPHGDIGYSVHFITLPDLALGTRVMTADTSGQPGYLAVDPVAGFVYYSHAGGGDKDAIYRIRTSTKSITDADNDGAIPYALDNDLVNGLFNQPGKLFYDHGHQKLVVANLGDTYVTMVATSLWGTLDRSANLSFPINGTSHLSTSGGSVADARAITMAYGAGVYVYAGIDNGQPYLGRFEINSASAFVLSFANRTWLLDNANIRVHPREDIFSVFILQEDSSGIAIAQYRMNNFVEVAGSPHHTRTIPDSVVTTFGLDTLSDRLIVADSESARLEIIGIN